MKINNYKFTNYKLIIINFQLTKLQVHFCNFATLHVYKILNLENWKLIITTLQIASAKLQLHKFESLQNYKFIITNL